MIGSGTLPALGPGRYFGVVGGRECPRTDPPPERMHWTEVGAEADETGVDPAANTAPARIRTTADVIDTTADRILRFRKLVRVTGADQYRSPVLGSGLG